MILASLYNCNMETIPKIYNMLVSLQNDETYYIA